MKKICLFLLLFPTFYLFAQSPKQRIIDRTAIGFKLRQSVQVGNKIYSTGFNESVSQAYPSLVKQNLELDPEWVDHFSRTGFSDRYFSTIHKTSANEIILTGAIGASGDHALWMLKLDTLENIVWEKDLSTSNDLGPNCFIPNQQDGGTILVTEYGSQWNINLVDINGNGDTLWTKRILSNTGANYRSPIGYWDANNNLNVIIRVGSEKEILKLDASGNLLSYRKISDGNGGSLNIKAVYNDGVNTYFVGSQYGGSYTSFILKMDANDNILWCKNYPEIQSFYGITEDINGDLITYGTINWGDLLNKVEVVKISSSGTPLIAKTYGQLPARHTLNSEILEVNNHFIISGWREYQSTETSYQLSLDRNLNSNSCYERNIQITSLDLTPTFTSITNPSISSMYPHITSFGYNSGTYLSFGIFVSYNLDNNLNTDIEVTGDDCGGTCNGSAVASSTGGNPSYNYEWSNGQNTSTATNLCYNNEIILITGDQLGCYRYDTLLVPQQAPVTDVCMVTVDSTSTQNIVVWEKPVSNTIQGFGIYREVVGNYTLMGYVPYDSLSQFTDNTNGVNPNITSYRYKISTLDTCGNESELSDYHETIHVTVNQGTNNNINLIWDNYEGFAFSYNRILRDTAGTGQWEVVDSVSSNVFTWTDINNPPSTVQYMVEVVLPSTCTATKQQSHNTTRSNRAGIQNGSGGTTIEEAILHQAEVYPNPFKATLTIQIATSEWEYQLIDLSGKIITSGVGTTTQAEVDLGNLEGGMYILQLSIGQTVFNKTVVKQ